MGKNSGNGNGVCRYIRAQTFNDHLIERVAEGEAFNLHDFTC